MDYSIVSKHRKIIMGFAALWIFYFHIAPMVFQDIGFINNIEWFMKRTGYSGVDIFLLLSSYGLYYSFSKMEKINYLYYIKSRIKRIAPAYVLALLVYTLLSREGIIFFVKRLVFVEQFAVNMYNFLWFVPCIIVFYIAAPFYYLIFKKINKKLVFTVVIIAIICLLCRKYGYLVRGDLYCIISRIPVFMLGFYMGYISKKGKSISCLTIVMSIVFVIFSGTISYMLNKGYIPLHLPYENCFINVFLAWGLCVIIAAICEKKKENGIIKKVLAFYGSISFEFYCFQEMIDKYIKSSYFGQYVDDGRRYLIMIFIAVFILSTIAAFLVSKCENTILVKNRK